MDTNIAETPVEGNKSLIGPWQILKSAYRLYKTYFRKLWLIFILGGLGSASFNLRLNGLSHLHVDVWVWVLVSILIIILWVLCFFSRVALYKSLVNIHNGRECVGIMDAYKNAKPLFWSFIFISILSSVAMSGGFVLLIIPAIILSIYIGFAHLYFIDRGEKGFKALLGSWRLVRGYWWDVFFRLIGVVLLGAIVFIALAIVGSVLFVLPAILFRGTVVSIVVLSVGLVLDAAFLFLFYIPIAATVPFVLYTELLRVKGAGLVVVEEVEKKRKKKLVALVVVGIIGTIVVGVLSFIGVYRATSNTNIIPHGSYYTFEDEPDFYTIDYPTTWTKSDEGLISTSDRYLHQVSFVPATGNEASSAQVVITSSNLPKGVHGLDDLKQFALQSFDLSNKEKMEKVESVSTSTVSVYPSVEIVSSGIATTTSPVRQEQFATMFVRGDFYYLLTFTAPVETYQKLLPDVKKMIDSWYLFYTNEKKGESKEYVSRDYGFKIEYPADWFAIGSIPDKTRVAEFSQPNYDVNGQLQESDNIRVVVTPTVKNTAAAFRDDYLTLLKSKSKKVVVKKTESTTLSGYPAASLTVDLQDPETSTSTPQTIVFMIHGGVTYGVSFIGSKIDETLINKVLNSFALIDKDGVMIQPSANDVIATYESRRFGHMISLPKDWERNTDIDLPNLTAESYLPQSQTGDIYRGVLGISTIDAALYPREYLITSYRDDSVTEWTRWYGKTRDFTLIETGTTTVDGNPAAFFVGTYKGEIGPNGEFPPTLEIKEVFVDKNNLKRWLSYIDDEQDFKKYVGIFDQSLKTFIWR